VNCLVYLDYPQNKWSFIAQPVSQSISDSYLSSLSLCNLTVRRSDLVLGYGSVCAASNHCVATCHLSPDVTVAEMLALLYWPADAFAVVAIIPLFAPLNNATPALADCSTATWLLGKSLQCVAWTRPTMSLSVASHKAPLSPPSQSSSLQFFILFPSPVSPWKQSNCTMPGLLERRAHDALQQTMREGYIKTATMLGDTASACIPWLVVSILTTATDWTGFCYPPSLFSYYLSAMLNTPVYLLLTSSSRRSPYLRYQRKYLVP